MTFRLAGPTQEFGFVLGAVLGHRTRSAMPDRIAIVEDPVACAGQSSRSVPRSGRGGLTSIRACHDGNLRCQRRRSHGRGVLGAQSWRVGGEIRLVPRPADQRFDPVEPEGCRHRLSDIPRRVWSDGDLSTCRVTLEPSTWGGFYRHRDCRRRATRHVTIRATSRSSKQGAGAMAQRRPVPAPEPNATGILHNPRSKFLV